MNQFNTIEDAVAALTKTYGIGLLAEGPRFIALLSDYAPNHFEPQKYIRAFTRVGGMKALSEDITARRPYATIIGRICSCAVNASADDDCRHEIVNSVKGIPLALDANYSTQVSSKEIYDVGMNYYRSFPKEKNIPIAVLILEEAWRLGSTDALLYISSSYMKGKGIPQNKEKGIHYLELAAKSNNLRATIELAECLWKGNGVEKNLSRAVTLLKSVDDPNAMYLLSEIYKENIEYSKAVDCLIHAAGRNHVYAQYDLAIAYATGQGTKRDIQEAKKWLRSAASLGHNEARRKLGELGEKWD